MNQCLYGMLISQMAEVVVCVCLIGYAAALAREQTSVLVIVISSSATVVFLACNLSPRHWHFHLCYIRIQIKHGSFWLCSS